MTKKILVDETVIEQAMEAIGAFQRGEACEQLFLDVFELLTDAQLASDKLSAEPLGFWLTGTELVEFVRCNYHDGPEWEPIFRLQEAPPETDSADAGAREGEGEGEDSDSCLTEALSEPVATLRVKMDRYDMGQSLAPNPEFKVAIAHAHDSAMNLPVGDYSICIQPAKKTSTVSAPLSSIDCGGPLCGLPEHGGGHHPLCQKMGQTN